MMLFAILTKLTLFLQSENSKDNADSKAAAASLLPSPEQPLKASVAGDLMQQQQAAVGKAAVKDEDSFKTPTSKFLDRFPFLNSPAAGLPSSAEQAFVSNWMTN